MTNHQLVVNCSGKWNIEATGGTFAQPPLTLEPPAISRIIRLFCCRPSKDSVLNILPFFSLIYAHKYFLLLWVQDVKFMSKFIGSRDDQQRDCLLKMDWIKTSNIVGISPIEDC